MRFDPIIHSGSDAHEREALLKEILSVRLGLSHGHYTIDHRL
jgi:hypothetical protein